MKKVYVFLAEGFEEMEAVTPIDLLRRAGVDAKLVSVTGNRAVTGAHGVTYLADLLFEEIEEDADMLVLPGGLPGTTNLQAHEGLTKLLLKQHEAHKWVAAICAAPMVLGALGIVKDRHATIYPGIEDKLIGAAPLTDEVVVDGNVITSRAPGTAIPFAIALAELLTDEKTAAALTEDLVFRKAGFQKTRPAGSPQKKRSNLFFLPLLGQPPRADRTHTPQFRVYSVRADRRQRLFSACRQANFPLPQAGEKRCPS